MARLFSKNTFIGLLLLTNAVTGTYILAKEKNFKTGASRPVYAGGLTSPPHAHVQEAVVKQTEIQACYETFLARRPAADEGAMIVHWVVNETGQLDLLKLIRSDFDDQPFADCVLEKIKNTQFPAASARAGILVSHKFNFHRKGDRAGFQ
jgi:hypothetical protein